MSDNNRFDELMFGPRPHSEDTTEQETENNDTFDLAKTIELLHDTYQKLSPIKDVFKNMKK
ncbi:hypothetical protein SH601_07220 [Gracilibacillus sp. S3-1-1]|uniref:Uncharacterized protein n=1 Tax=Gracilibacillus pellucidus TaxID=3095368 RepID=A0ACC6M471_9BACI|nr:hypothetical protein [Gracilibacillus sp. S3-1-1]MDX8045778.1 hypothetical protein [Gracilibacillus sp. S3-1-1]